MRKLVGYSALLAESLGAQRSNLRVLHTSSIYALACYKGRLLRRLWLLAMTAFGFLLPALLPAQTLDPQAWTQKDG
ncbi:MAG TPA: hypothetical protein VFA55_06105, partial [Candidatus Kapabacteria bacterium]|nr:hypothetical protein [Candidatus Kapabacteria bacterium]